MVNTEDVSPAIIPEISLIDRDNLPDYWNNPDFRALVTYTHSFFDLLASLNSSLISHYRSIKFRKEMYGVEGKWGDVRLNLGFNKNQGFLTLHLDFYPHEELENRTEPLGGSLAEVNIHKRLYVPLWNDIDEHSERCGIRREILRDTENVMEKMGLKKSKRLYNLVES